MGGREREKEREEGGRDSLGAYVSGRGCCLFQYGVCYCTEEGGWQCVGGTHVCIVKYLHAYLSIIYYYYAELATIMWEFLSRLIPSFPVLLSQTSHK